MLITAHCETVANISKLFIKVSWDKWEKQVGINPPIIYM